MSESCATSPSGAHTYRDTDIVTACKWCGLIWREPGRIRRFGKPAPNGRFDRRRKPLIERDGKSCRYCGKASDALTVEHLTPRSRGGTGNIHNLGLSCFDCNNRKGSLTDAEFRRAMVSD